jgi:hypothetical protein
MKKGAVAPTDIIKEGFITGKHNGAERVRRGRIPPLFSIP